MRCPLEVTHSDGRVETCIAEYPDLCEFESTFNRSCLRLNSELRLTDLGFLAWHSLKRQNKHALPFDQWNLTVTMVRATDEETELVPLEQ